MCLNTDMEIYLLLKYFKRQTSEQEDYEVQQWLAADEDGSRAAEYRRAHLLFSGMSAHWTPTCVPKRKKLFQSVRKLVYAASAAAVAVVAIFTTAYVTKNRTMDTLASQMEKIVVPPGRPIQFTLSDGTELWLNAGTELVYPSVFSSDDRTVKLVSGEVLFDVAKDEKRPFIVQTYASDISVLGTKFNVYVDETNDDFSAALVRGTIKVVNNGDKEESYVLSPNDVVRKRGNHLYVGRMNDVESAICWTKGLMDIVDVPFDELMKRLELMYDVDIVIEREHLPEVSYTWGKIRISEGLENALSILSKGCEFTWLREPRTGTIFIR